MSLTVALETLGCKVNQYESSYLSEVLTGAGYKLVPFRRPADIYIVHSCAVTSKAAFQTRQLLRRAKRNNADAQVMVLGCDAQLESTRIAKEKLATHILGASEKLDLLHWMDVAGSFTSPCLAVGDARLAATMQPLPTTRMYSGRARAFLKVQDGCDSFCSYCIVPYTRGKSRSLASQHVRSQLDRYLDYGYQEVVFTGIHLGQWGRDLDPPQDLASLLKFLAGSSLPARIRLSSLESVEWSDDLLCYLNSNSSICPHFHVPLQSGSNEILKAMHRPYTPRQYIELIVEINRKFPRAGIGADVMVGFPGETDRHFQETVELIDRLPLTYLHVFPFSPRPGTDAAELSGRVTGGTLKQRAKFLRNLDTNKRMEFRQSNIGQTAEVLVETQIDTGLWRGTSDNYLQVMFHSANHSVLPGSLVKVRLKKLHRTGIVSGEPLSTP